MKYKNINRPKDTAVLVSMTLFC